MPSAVVDKNTPPDDGGAPDLNASQDDPNKFAIVPAGPVQEVIVPIVEEGEENVRPEGWEPPAIDIDGTENTMEDKVL